MNADQLWEDRNAILSMATSLCTAPAAIIEIRAANTAEEACELACAFQNLMRGRNREGWDYWERHQADCKSLCCYHLEKLAGIIGWQTNEAPEPNTKS